LSGLYLLTQLHGEFLQFPRNRRPAGVLHGRRCQIDGPRRGHRLGDTCHRRRCRHLNRRYKRTLRRLPDLLRGQAAGEQILATGSDQRLLTTQLILQIQHTHFGDRTVFGDRRQTLNLLLHQVRFSRCTEEFGLSILQVFAEQLQGEQSLSGLYRINGKAMNRRHHTHSRRRHATVRNPRTVANLTWDLHGSPVVLQLCRERNQIQISLGLGAKPEHFHGGSGGSSAASGGGFFGAGF